jgi:RimJ/RimL family protein N-acetyltransferase
MQPVGGSAPGHPVSEHRLADARLAQVTLWSHEDSGTAMSEIGWMVLPEFQGRGIAKAAVRMLLTLTREQERWGLVHAFPAITNGPSNSVCRSSGFRFAGEQETTFAGRIFHTNHWVINPATDLTTANA